MQAVILTTTLPVAQEISSVTTGVSEEILEPFRKAIREGDHNTMIEMLEGADGSELINYRDPTGGNFLHFAVRCGQLLPTECLLEYGVDPTLKTNNGVTPLSVFGRELENYQCKLAILNYMVQNSGDKMIGEGPSVAYSLYRELLESVFRFSNDLEVIESIWSQLPELVQGRALNELLNDQLTIVGEGGRLAVPLNPLTPDEGGRQDVPLNPLTPDEGGRLAVPLNPLTPDEGGRLAVPLNPLTPDESVETGDEEDYDEEDYDEEDYDEEENSRPLHDVFLERLGVLQEYHERTFQKILASANETGVQLTRLREGVMGDGKTSPKIELVDGKGTIHFYNNGELNEVFAQIAGKVDCLFLGSRPTILWKTGDSWYLNGPEGIDYCEFAPEVESLLLQESPEDNVTWAVQLDGIALYRKVGDGPVSKYYPLRVRAA